MSYEFRGRTRSRTDSESGRRPAQSRAAREPRVPMHAFAASSGLLFLLVGIAGFIPGVTSNYDELELAGPESGAELLGLLEVSVLHNIVHLLFAVGLIAAARYAWARLYLLGGGVAYLGVFIYGVLVDHDSEANFLPLNDADNVFHLVLGLAMIGLGVLGSGLAKPGDVTAA